MVENVKKDKEGFERAFDLVGGHGKFQLFILAVTSYELILLTWNHLGYIFIGAVPNHWCKIDELQNVNWSTEQIKDLTIPKLGGNGNNTDWKYDQCEYYDLDYNDLVQRFNGSFKDALHYVRQLNSENMKTKECSNWEYDNSMYSSTIVSQFNLVCGRRYLTATIQSTYMIGGLIGTFFFGILNDKILGRRNSALIAICIILIGGFLAALSTTYWMFIALRMLIAIGTAGCMQASNVLLVEHCDIATRAKFYCYGGAFFGVGYTIMPIYAYYIRDWSSLQLAFSLTTLTLLSFFWIFPESPRWLASKGKDKEAVRSLQRIGKINGKAEPKEADLLLIVQSCHKHHQESPEISKGLCQFLGETCRNIKSLVDTREGCKRTLTLWALFFIVAFVYYGFAFSPNITSNPYLGVALGALMEIPACILPTPFLTMWGRRPTTSLCYFFAGFFAFSIAVTPNEYEAVRMVFMMCGKLFVAAAFNVVYLVASEIYPTVSRTTGQSASTIMGRFGSIITPYVADLLTTVYPDLPCVIFGILSITGAGVALLLPEMKDMDMMDQVSELELAQI